MKKLRHSLKRNILYVTMMSPAVICMLFVMAFPVIYSFVMSLFDWKLGKTPKFVGIENYINIFAIPDVYHSIWITLLFCVIVTVLTIAIGLYFAVLLNMELKGTKFVIPLLLIPWALPPIVSGFMWKWIFNARLGTFNNVLIKMGLLDNFRTWQVEKWPAFFIIVIATIYTMVPISAFIFTSSLKTIPKHLYEAAEIDGASTICRFFKITLPCITPSMVVVSVLLSVVTFKAFDIIYIITGGGPGNFTSVLNFLSYQTSFKFMKFGFGAAIAFFVSFFIIIISVFYYKSAYKEMRYD